MKLERLLLEELTRDQARQLAPEALFVWPVGSLEQHRPHLPVGTDHLTIEYLARTRPLEGWSAYAS